MQWRLVPNTDPNLCLHTGPAIRAALAARIAAEASPTGTMS
jgi:hypothetical protein